MGRTVDQEAAIRVLEKVLVQGAGIGGEFANNFLEDILDRNQALDIAILIDDKADAPLVLAKIN